MGNKLPDLPPSDEQSLQKNAYQGFYKIGAREFWGENEINYQTVEDKKCQHYFMREGLEVRCKVCYIGWDAPYEVNTKDGKLYFKDQLVGL
jgi:hypothetical protein